MRLLLECAIRLAREHTNAAFWGFVFKVTRSRYAHAHETHTHTLTLSNLSAVLATQSVRKCRPSGPPYIWMLRERKLRRRHNVNWHAPGLFRPYYYILHTIHTDIHMYMLLD